MKAIGTAAGALDVLALLFFLFFTASMVMAFLSAESAPGFAASAFAALGGAWVSFLGLRNLARRITQDL